MKLKETVRVSEVLPILCKLYRAEQFTMFLAPLQDAKYTRTGENEMEMWQTAKQNDVTTAISKVSGRSHREDVTDELLHALYVTFCTRAARLAFPGVWRSPQMENITHLYNSRTLSLSLLPPQKKSHSGTTSLSLGTAPKATVNNSCSQQILALEKELTCSRCSFWI